MGGADFTMPPIHQNDREFDDFEARAGFWYKMKSFYNFEIVDGRVDGYIYLRENFSESDMPLLIHETVHHWQAITGQKYTCRQAKERPAYELQDKYALAHAQFDYVMDEHNIDTLSACPGKQKEVKNEK
jgi:hypothetical protein